MNSIHLSPPVRPAARPNRSTSNGPAPARRLSGAARRCSWTAIASLALLAASVPRDVHAADGARAFRNACGPCHSANVVHRIGPSLVGVVGRVSGTARDFDYSDAMKKAAVTWDASTLDRFLAAPNSMVAGTRMTFPGLKDDEKRRAIVEFIGSLHAE